MCICNFEMQGIKEKHKKQKILRSLCRVYAHGKGPFGHFAVCIHTAKTPRGAYLCVGVARWFASQGLCRACWCTAHGKEGVTTHGNIPARQREKTRQRPPARQREQRTAASLGTATARDTRQRRMAWQTPGMHGNVLTARQSSLPSLLRETHGKVFVAGHYFAVPPLPCVDARQRRCRAFWCLCRAICPHGKALFSGSEYSRKRLPTVSNFSLYKGDNYMEVSVSCRLFIHKVSSHAAI
jgi:hypothetical protein